ncbi:hypothetical protein BD413DRAFT_56451 [Trametes elegans]|nr:hypothetical protein BD413DRAFT_56451 [Trametes elegans]
MLNSVRHTPTARYTHGFSRGASHCGVCQSVQNWRLGCTNAADALRMVARSRNLVMYRRIPGDRTSFPFRHPRTAAACMFSTAVIPARTRVHSASLVVSLRSSHTFRECAYRYPELGDPGLRSNARSFRLGNGVSSSPRSGTVRVQCVGRGSRSPPAAKRALAGR